MALAPSTPADRAPRLPRTRCHATSRNAGSWTRLNTSRNRRPGSSPAQRCSLAWISHTRRSACPRVGHSSGGASVFTVDLRAFQHPHCQLAGSLRPADGFPALRLLRSLRPTRLPSTDDESARHCPGRAAGRATTGGSHVHHEPIDEGDAQLYPGRLATSTPQPFLVASSPVCSSRLRSRPPRVHRGRARRTDPDPPGSSRLDAYGASCAGSSRTPSRLACRTRAVWQCRRAPSLSGLLPTLPGVPRIRLSSASTRLLRQPSGKSIPPLLGHTGASWRTNRSSNRRPGSAAAQWCSLVCILNTLANDPSGTVSSGASVFTNASLAIAASSLLVTAAALRLVAGSPGLGLLRRLRPVPTRSVDDGHSPTGHAGG